MKTIKYSFFKNGVTMLQVSNLFLTDWEANRFQSDAINKGLIKFCEDGEFRQIETTSNIGVKTISVDRQTGQIMKVNH